MFRYEIPVRYSECDAQGVVFNAHYLAFCDHAMDEFLRAALGDASDFQAMLKSAHLTWIAPLRYRETAAVTCRVSRWGRSSMDVDFVAAVDDDVRFEATITYVCIDVDSEPAESMPIPTDVRAAFEALGG